MSRRLLLVAGVGRSGTSLVTGILGQVGWHIPQPEIQADETNPRGFGEPAWVVGFHQRHMRKIRMTVFDSRPEAWVKTDAVAEQDEARAELREWLGEQFRQSDAVVVKDPRVGWFLPLWLNTARDLSVPVSFLAMLRHPAEIVTSAKRSYGDWQKDASRTSAWINVTLETERKTRGVPRAFVRYQDLLADWERELRRVGQAVGDPQLAGIERARFPAVDEFVDPTLHRNRVGWDSLDVPDSVRALAERVWRELQPLASADGDGDGARAALDASHAEYERLYAEAEAIAQSSVTAAKPRKQRLAPPTTRRGRIFQRIPQPYRRWLRRVLSVLPRRRA